MADPLTNMMKAATSAMNANDMKAKVAAENMANAKSANYTPKSIHFRARVNPGDGTETVEIAKISRETKKIHQVHDPTHPQADAQGMVTMPDVNPLISLLDLQESKHATERALQAYKMGTDLKHKMIKMIGGN